MDRQQGLSEEDAARRLVQDGPNELARDQPRGVLELTVGTLKEPMFLLLLGCGGLYLLLGDVQEALTLLSFVVLTIGISVRQGRRTERAVAALRSLSSPRALVVRGGVRHRIPGREVVTGDVLLLSEGDRVPADATVVESSHLSVDESLITGESVPVRKRAAEPAEARVFSGTLVVKGHAAALVTATGPKSELGKLATVVAEEHAPRTPLQREVDTLVRRLTFVGAGLCLTLMAVMGLAYGQWLKGLLAGLTLAMAMLPEEIPLVLSVFVTLGAWRLSKAGVLARNSAALEALGAATVLCVDKTGTLTRNQLELVRLQTARARHDTRQDTGELEEEFHPLAEFAVLASQREAFDPIDAACQRFGQAQLGATEHWHADWALEREYPLSDQMLALCHVYRPLKKEPAVVAAKGAPEAIADLCHLGEEALAKLRDQVTQMAEDGLRVLGVARARFEGPLPTEQHDFEFELLGLIGFLDPVRDEVPQAIAQCQAAGVRVVMVTGDHPRTAAAIARNAGLKADVLLTGDELDKLDDTALAERVKHVEVCARIQPAQKLRIVKAFRARGEVVSMTGDGVNDAPALKAADIGVAMGGRGTDVARESASLVLVNDSFASILTGVRTGRRIFDNLRKAVAYIVAVHLPIASLSLIPAALGLQVLLPIHVVFLEMIIDPACSIVFEAEGEEPGLMTRRPRRLTDKLFRVRDATMALVQGVLLSLACFAVLGFGYYSKVPPDQVRAAIFLCLVAGNLGLIWSNLGRKVPSTNAALNWVLVGAAGLAGLAVALPTLREVFHFSALGWQPALGAAALGVAVVAPFRWLKGLFERSA